MRFRKLLASLFFLILACATRAQDTITVTCSEDYYQANANFSLTIDGASVTASRACTTRNPSPRTKPATPQTINFSGNWGGTTPPHLIVITFLNDAYGGTTTTDRNLFIWSVSFDGIAAPAPALSGAIALAPAGAEFDSESSASWTIPGKPLPPPVPPPSGASSTISFSGTDASGANTTVAFDASKAITVTIRAANGGIFTATNSVVSTLTISSVAPNSGPAGTSFTIIGTGFVQSGMSGSLVCPARTGTNYPFTAVSYIDPSHVSVSVPQVALPAGSTSVSCDVVINTP